MATPVQMPQMGESVVEGTILRWLKAEGDSIDVDEPIVEVSTDKVDTEIPSPVGGTMSKILVQEGDTVEVGSPICEIEESGAGGAKAEAPAEAPAEEKDEPAAPETPPAEQEEGQGEGEAAAEPEPAAPAPAQTEAPEAAPAAAQRPAATTTTAPATDGDGQGQVLSPLVRRLAREHDVDLSQVRGSGAGGRVTKKDVLDFVEKGGAPAAAPEAAPASAPAAQTKGAPAPAPAAAGGQREESVPLSHIRKRIAEHMVRSLQTSARAWNAIEVDVENIAKLREQAGGAFKQREGFSLTYLPFICRAVCDALTAHPVVNASLSEDLSEAVYHRYVNLGVAVATDYGLIVPVVKGAEGLTVVGIARAIRELAEKARSKSLSPDDVGGSTFSITNPGPFGSYVSLPVINQPNVAILGTELVEKRVAVVDDMIAIRHRTFLTMSWDHRLLDGADAMRFLARLKENLETWDFSHELG